MVILNKIVLILERNWAIKIKASSLTEVMVATTIILLIFGIAIATLNNVMLNTVNRNTQAIETELNRLQYLYKKQQLKIPFTDKIENWTITAEKTNEHSIDIILFEAHHLSSKKQVIKKQVTLEIK